MTETISQNATQNLPSNGLDWQLPEHVIEELAPKRHDYCIVIPVLNEGERISRQLGRMMQFCGDCDIVIADGNSTDGCTTLEQMELFGVRAILRKLGPGKMSAQMRMGYAYALRQGYLGIIQIDGNNKDGVEAIPEYVQLLREGADCVLGSRYLHGGAAINTPFIRDIAVRFIHSPLISLAAGRRMTDTTNSFRAFSRRFLFDRRVKPFRDVFMRYNLPYYLAVRAAQLRYRVDDVPVVRAYPNDASVPTKIHGLKEYFGIIAEVLHTVIGTYTPRQ
jgi:dolichol-phosphate mannosyltransferase